MLAGRAAAEILPREKNRRIPVLGLIQHKVRIQGALRAIHAGLSLIEVAPAIEEVRTVPGLIDRLQELLRNNGIRVDV